MIDSVEVLGNAVSIHIHLLISLQDQDIRIMTSLKYTTYKNHLNFTTGIMPFNILVEYRIVLLMYKLPTGSSPVS